MNIGMNKTLDTPYHHMIVVVEETHRWSVIMHIIGDGTFETRTGVSVDFAIDRRSMSLEMSFNDFDVFVDGNVKERPNFIKIEDVTIEIVPTDGDGGYEYGHDGKFVVFDTTREAPEALVKRILRKLSQSINFTFNGERCKTDLNQFLRDILACNNEMSFFELVMLAEEQ